MPVDSGHATFVLRHQKNASGQAATWRLSRRADSPNSGASSNRPRLSLPPAESVANMNNRERCKYYRERRRKYEQLLEGEVEDLQDQITALQATRQVHQELSIARATDANGSLARLVNEYYAQFAQGTPVALQFASNASEIHAAPLRRVAKATQTQASFLYAAMKKNVRFGDFQGVDTLLDQWQRYSTYHSSISFGVKSLQVLSRPSIGESEMTYEDGSAVVIVVHGDLKCRISKETLENIFPQALRHPDLMQRLIGLEVTYPCINEFFFAKDGKIERYNAQVMFVEALMDAVKSIMDVSKMLGDALIVKDHMIGQLNSKEAEVARQDAEALAVGTDMEDMESNGDYDMESSSDYDTPPISKHSLGYILS